MERSRVDDAFEAIDGVHALLDEREIHWGSFEARRYYEHVGTLMARGATPEEAIATIGRMLTSKYGRVVRDDGPPALVAPEPGRLL